MDFLLNPSFSDLIEFLLVSANSIKDFDSLTQEFIINLLNGILFNELPSGIDNYLSRNYLTQQGKSNFCF